MADFAQQETQFVRILGNFREFLENFIQRNAKILGTIWEGLHEALPTNCIHQYATS